MSKLGGEMIKKALTEKSANAEIFGSYFKMMGLLCYRTSFLLLMSWALIHWPGSRGRYLACRWIYFLQKDNWKKRQMTR